MKHSVAEQFREQYNALPVAIRKSADNNFEIIKQYPNHPLLRLVRIDNIISMRIGSRCRAIGVEDRDTTVWFWIGTYKQYKKLF
ncbi:MAG: hypothetical protein WCT99_09975 [Bacteroidota bacterium]|jgi:hypothetical protein